MIPGRDLDDTRGVPLDALRREPTRDRDRVCESQAARQAWKAARTPHVVAEYLRGTSVAQICRDLGVSERLVYGMLRAGHCPRVGWRPTVETQETGR